MNNDTKSLLRQVGAVALDLVSTFEGHSSSLSVEIWTSQAVWLRVRSGHEMRIYVRDGMVRWERTDPGARKDSKPISSNGSLALMDRVTIDDIRVFLARWLSWRAR